MTRQTHGHATRTNGGPTAEYRIWCNMIQRCAHSGHEYRNYYGRGIKVCRRWRSFAKFLSDMGPRPSSKHTIDRIDNDGDYAPANCRWADRKQQMRNTRVNRLLTYKGETLSVAEWADRVGISADTIRVRLHRGKSVERALSTKNHRRPE